MLTALTNLQRFFSAHPLTRDRPLDAWLRFVRWQIISRFQEEIVVSWIAGQRLAVRRGMTGATGNIYVGLHEFVDMMVPCHLLREGDLFLDIGANIGSYSVLASGVCHASTIAFEPDPQTVERLRRNIEINSLGSRVEICEFALGAKSEMISFTVGLDSINRVSTGSGEKVRAVRQEMLDDVLGDRHPIMIKADVEGYEEQVLRGAPKILENGSLKVVELETHTPWIREMLSNHGFEHLFYDPFSRELRKTPKYEASNALFVRDQDFVQYRLRTAQRVRIHGQEI